jgi:hypothetical protein
MKMIEGFRRHNNSVAPQGKTSAGDRDDAELTSAGFNEWMS